MKFVSLFAGIGGIDLGLERAGFTCVGQVESGKYQNKVLNKNWPNVPKISKVQDFQGHEFGPFDLLAGGYPCQPFSHAGKRKGGEDERHLWPEVNRIIRAVRPQYVLLENVTAHLTLGFDTVLGNLAESGYDAIWDCIPASSLGAPHQRDRLFILSIRIDTNAELGILADTDSEQELSLLIGSGQERNRQESPQGKMYPLDRITPTPPRGEWVPEPNVGRMVNGFPHRMDRLLTLGNAVVPQVAEWIADNWIKPTQPNTRNGMLT
jgi:DNA (cytosine-5)-methyltransferase 1